MPAREDSKKREQKEKTRPKKGREVVSKGERDQISRIEWESGRKGARREKGRKHEGGKKKEAQEETPKRENRRRRETMVGQNFGDKE